MLLMFQKQKYYKNLNNANIDDISVLHTDDMPLAGYL